MVVLTSRPFLATSFYPRGRDPFHCFIGGRIQVHPTGFVLGLVQISGWQLRSRHTRAIYGQDKRPIFSLLSYRRVYTPSSILLRDHSCTFRWQQRCSRILLHTALRSCSKVSINLQFTLFRLHSTQESLCVLSWLPKKRHQHS